MTEGRPIQIISNHFELNEIELKRILEHDDIKDRFVVVVSVAGAFRKGKSFLLSFFIKYLKALYVGKDSSNWLGRSDQSLEGFSWTNGPERETIGIWMWSDVFLHEENGKKFAIILLDTQGVFDNETTSKNCAVIFALSTLLSSLQIYNVSGNIEANDLQHLQSFTEYGKMALESTGETPFQELLFLIRDWSYQHSFEYGPVGGNRLINHVLANSKNQNEELKSVREHLKSCFSKIDCFLMPHPGMKILDNENFDGRLEDLSEEFKSELDILVQMVLSPEQLMVKEVNGEQLKAKELLNFFKIYLQILAGDKLPQPKTIFQANTEVSYINTFAEYKEIYMKEMAELYESNEAYNSEDLTRKHEEIKGKLIEKFDAKKKMGGPELDSQFKIELISYLDNMFKIYKQQNQEKNELASALTEYDHVSITAKIKDLYFLEMETILQSNKGFEKNDFLRIHTDIKKKCIEMFILKCNENNINHEELKDRLEEYLDELSQIFEAKNEVNLKLFEREMNEEYSRILKETINSYSEEMDRIVEQNKLISKDALEIAHNKIKITKIHEMVSKINDETYSNKYRQNFELLLDNSFIIFQKRVEDMKKLLQVEAESKNLELVNEARSNYIRQVNTLLCQNQESQITPEKLQAIHFVAKQESLEYFQRNKMEGDLNSRKHIESLNSAIDEIYQIYLSQIQSKMGGSVNIFTNLWKEVLLPFLAIFIPASRSRRRNRL